ncbi:MAG: hypothetical protein IRZ00_14850, partial [Gemmatimonadetes bacterium]|nr:hypothetical protein [Gemmatimonadota bacterium]
RGVGGARRPTGGDAGDVTAGAVRAAIPALSAQGGAFPFGAHPAAYDSARR